MNIFYISKVSFSMYMKNIQWFLLFMLPAPLLVKYFALDLVQISQWLYFAVDMFVSFLIAIIGITLIDKIHHNEHSRKTVLPSSAKHILPILGFNFQFVMIIVLMGIVIAVVQKSPIFALLVLLAFSVILINLSLRWSLVQTVIVTENLGTYEGMKRSSELMMGYKLPMFLMVTVLMLGVALIMYAHYIYLGAQNYQMYQIILALSPKDAMVLTLLITLYVPIILIHIYLFYQRRLALLDVQDDENNDVDSKIATRVEL
jgi:hypothetical protein